MHYKKCRPSHNITDLRFNPFTSRILLPQLFGSVWLVFIILHVCLTDFPVFNADSVDPDQMLHSVMSDQDIYCLPITVLGFSRLKWVNTTLYNISIRSRRCHNNLQDFYLDLLLFHFESLSIFWLLWKSNTLKPLLVGNMHPCKLHSCIWKDLIKLSLRIFHLLCVVFPNVYFQIFILLHCSWC